MEKWFEATVEEVHSGDDLVVLVNLGVDGLFKKVRARLRGVDTPSAYKAKHSTEAGTVRDDVRSVIGKHPCTLLLHSNGRGGWLITLTIHPPGAEPINLNEYLISKGYVFQSKSEQESTQ